MPDFVRRSRLEYAVAVLATPLILVLGHDACGAVEATIKSVQDGSTLPGHLPSLVVALSPSVKTSAGCATAGSKWSGKACAAGAHAIAGLAFAASAPSTRQGDASC